MLLSKQNFFKDDNKYTKILTSKMIWNHLQLFQQRQKKVFMKSYLQILQLFNMVFLTII